MGRCFFGTGFCCCFVELGVKHVIILGTTLNNDEEKMSMQRIDVETGEI